MTVKAGMKHGRASTWLTPYGTSFWALILTACGGGGSGSGSGTQAARPTVSYVSPTPVHQVSDEGPQILDAGETLHRVSGRVANGPVEGARVYVDVNSNNVLDDQDRQSGFVGRTDSTGWFDGKVPARFANRKILADLNGARNHGDPANPHDTVDAPNTVWRAPQGSKMISALTEILVQTGVTRAELARTFGLPADMDVTLTDPFEAGPRATEGSTVKQLRDAGSLANRLLQHSTVDLIERAEAHTTNSGSKAGVFRLSRDSRQISERPVGNSHFPVKLADIVIIDDGVGTNTPALAGENAGIFMLRKVGNQNWQLWLGSGGLDFETSPNLSALIRLETTGSGPSPGDLRFTLNLRNINETTKGHVAITAESRPDGSFLTARHLLSDEDGDLSYRYEWRRAGSDTVLGAGQSFTANTPGRYEVTVIARDAVFGTDSSFRALFDNPVSLASVDVYEHHPTNKALYYLDGDGTYTLAAGVADNDMFRISADGGIWFRRSPDFEAPADIATRGDGAGNNSYQIHIARETRDGSVEILRLEVTVHNLVFEERRWGWSPSQSFEEFSSGKFFGKPAFYVEKRDIAPGELPQTPSDGRIGVAHLVYGEVWRMPVQGPLVLTWSIATSDSPDAARQKEHLSSQADIDSYRQLISSAFSEFEEVANLRFIEVGESADSVGNIRFQLAPFLPHRHKGSAGYPNSDSVIKLAINDSYAGQKDNFYRTILHEIGHAMGLKHPFDDVADWGFDWDFDTQARTSAATILAYNDTVKGLTALDIAALQFLYGAPESHNDGIAGRLVSPAAIDNQISTRQGILNAPKRSHETPPVETPLPAGSKATGFSLSRTELSIEEGIRPATRLADILIADPDQRGINVPHMISGDHDFFELRWVAGEWSLWLKPGKELDYDALRRSDHSHVIDIRLVSSGAGDDQPDIRFTLSVTSGNQTLTGTAGSDNIDGGPGEDAVDGGGGDDILKGGLGNDTLTGGPGKDILTGGPGRDIFDVSDLAANLDEADVITDFEPGRDKIRITGDIMVRYAFGDTNQDEVTDSIIIYAALDSERPPESPAPFGYWLNPPFVQSVEGRKVHAVIQEYMQPLKVGDFVSGTLSQLYGVSLIRRPVVNGDNGPNRLFGDPGANNINGLGGDDTLHGGAGGDVLDGGDGTDTASYALSPLVTTNVPEAQMRRYIEEAFGNHPGLSVSIGGNALGVMVNLETNTGRFGDAEGDRFRSIENLEGSRYIDLLIGDSGDNVIQGGGYKDFIVGGDGNDRLISNSPFGHLRGGAGIDTLIGKGRFFIDRHDIIQAEGDRNTAVWDDDIDARLTVVSDPSQRVGAGEIKLSGFGSVIGGGLNDVIKNDAAARVYMNGGAGDDVLITGQGWGHMTGGEGRDIFEITPRPQGSGNTYAIKDFTQGEDKIRIDGATRVRLWLRDTDGDFVKDATAISVQFGNGPTTPGAMTGMVILENFMDDLTVDDFVNPNIIISDWG